MSQPDSRNDVLVVAETRSGTVTPLTLELLGIAQTVARERSGRVNVALMGSNDAAGRELIAHGADRVHVCEGPGEDYEADLWLPAIERIVKEVRPLAVLAGHTPTGADLAPRLAFRISGGIATACVDVSAEDGKLLFTRPCYGGNVRETLSFAAQPAVATVKPGVGTPQRTPSSVGEVTRVAAQSASRRTRVVSRHRDTASATRLEDAKIIVAGGRGLEGPEGFRVLEKLAEVLGAAVGSSRVPCDLGWCPHSWQIGLTGKTVTPELYFAVGISGAGHHMAGCGNAKTIVAINTDPHAAIVKEARFGVVGDYRKIVPALASAVSRLKQ